MPSSLLSILRSSASTDLPYTKSGGSNTNTKLNFMAKINPGCECLECEVLSVHKKRRTIREQVTRINSEGSRRQRDVLVVEEPLTVLWQALEGAPERLSATMRTPGHDNELTAGLLFSEGLIQARHELDQITACVGGGVNQFNRLKAILRLSREQCESRLDHRPSQTMPQSACGLCSVEELGDPEQLVEWAARWDPGPNRCQPESDLLHKALNHLEKECPVFSATGASHACIMVSPEGALLVASEDVGRHNACDKAVGTLLLRSKGDRPFALPEGTGILFSSRLSFELAAKAVRAGAAWIASVGAPTHLAVRLAQKCSLPTLGFTSRERHNIYVAPKS